VILTLPSGNAAPLRAPGLTELVEAGGNVVAIVLRARAHPDIELDAENLDVWLGEGDRWAIGRRCLAHLDTDDIDALAALANTFAIAPSVYLGLEDRVAGLDLDLRVAARIAELRGSDDGETHGAASPTACCATMDDPA
jgi:hypothetical protein